MYDAPESELLFSTPMKPAFLIAAFPHLHAKVKDKYPLLTDSLETVIVTDIQPECLSAWVPFMNRAAYDVLTTESSKEILLRLVQGAMNNQNCRFDLRYQVDPATQPLEIPMKPETPIEPVPSPRAPRQQNKLELAQQIALVDWMRKNTDMAKTEPDSRLAAMAAAALDFHVTVANIASTRQALGIEKVKPEAPPTIEERLAIVEQQLKTLLNALPDGGQGITVETPAQS